MQRIEIGEIRGVDLDVVGADAVGAETELAVACMFSHELGPGLTGGLLDLNHALGGALTRLRQDGIFSGAEEETMLLAAPGPVWADNILLVGLGDPETFADDRVARAVQISVREAIRLGTCSAALAPGLLDSGLAPDALGSIPVALIRGLAAALPERSGSLHRWSFCSGKETIERHARSLRLALATVSDA